MDGGVVGAEKRGRKGEERGNPAYKSLNIFIACFRDGNMVFELDFSSYLPQNLTNLFVFIIDIFIMN